MTVVLAFLGYTVVHPFTPVGKNLELLLVCDKEDLKSWEKQNVPLSIVTRLKETSRTEINHTRYVRSAEEQKKPRSSVVSCQ